MQLKELNKAAVQPAGRPVRILQFGEGNFLRAFVDWQIDIANEKGGNGHQRSRGACRRFSAGSAIKRLQAQDGLYLSRIIYGCGHRKLHFSTGFASGHYIRDAGR